MEKKKLIFIPIIFIIIGLVVFIIYYLISTINANRYRKERYNYTFNYLSENVDLFEKLFEYDLEHCYKYDSVTVISSKDVFIMPEDGEPYSKEREILFKELGLYDGFDYGWIYPESGRIELYDRVDYCMHITYIKEGSDDYEGVDKIGNNIEISYYKIQPSE